MPLAIFSSSLFIAENIGSKPIIIETGAVIGPTLIWFFDKIARIEPINKDRIMPIIDETIKVTISFALNGIINRKKTITNQSQKKNAKSYTY